MWNLNSIGEAKNTRNLMTTKCLYREQIKLIKMTSDVQPRKIDILQTYMPTCDGTDEKEEEIY